jgi:hypothetical protein
VVDRTRTGTTGVHLRRLHTTRSPRGLTEGVPSAQASPVAGLGGPLKMGPRSFFSFFLRSE